MCSILHVPDEMHHYIRSILHLPDITLCPKKCIIVLCSILHVSEEMHHCMCPKKYINAYARSNASSHCARINASLHYARRNALLHCARDCIAPETCISPSLHHARSLHMPESNQGTIISTDAKNRYSLFTHYLYPKGTTRCSPILKLNRRVPGSTTYP